MEWSKLINHYTNNKELNPSAWMEQISTQISTTQTVLRTCVGWVFELGTSPKMSFYQKKNLAMINIIAFVSLLLALPGTFLLMLMGFNHTFSLLICTSFASCLILGFNGARRVEWAKVLFAFTPSAVILAYTLLELSIKGLSQPLNYLLARQGLCFALLIPVFIYGFEQRQKIMVVFGACLLIFLVYDVGSMRLGAFQNDNISGLSHGLFSVLSLMQYAGLAGCVLYMQYYTIQHIQQSQRDNEKYKSMAIRDGLTGLYNHSFMRQMVSDAIKRSTRSKNPLSLLMIDVDLFKQINDTFGHNTGDEVLVRLTRLLNDSKRSTDYLGRWGGDELILLLADTNQVGAYNLAQKLRSLVESQTFPNGKHLTISLGASEYQDGDTPASFISRADAALYTAKRSGRNKVELHQNTH